MPVWGSRVNFESEMRLLDENCSDTTTVFGNSSSKVFLLRLQYPCPTGINARDSSECTKASDTVMIGQARVRMVDNYFT
jgi:hypothetical protein